MSIRTGHYRTIFLLVSLIFLSGTVRAQVAPPQPSLIGTPEIIVEHGKGTGKALIHLRNNSTAPMAVSLSGVISSSAKPSGARISFARENDPGSASEVFDFTIPNQEIVKLWAMVSDVWEAGDFEAELRNKNTATGDKIRIRNSPFNVKLGGPDPDKVELSLVKDQIATIIIKNEDPTPYSLSWRLRIGSRDVCGNNFTIDRNSIALLECRPSVSFSPSRLSDLFKSDSTEGNQLLLYPQINSGNTAGVSPWKSFPVKASLNYFGLFTQQVVSYLAIVLVLILGGLTSLFLSQALPNRLKRLNILDQLDTLARTISDFSSNIDSKLQVLTRVERSRLREQLTSRNTVSPDFSGLVTECETLIAKLSTRVELIRQMDLVFGRLTQIRQDIPPTRIDEIDACLDRAKTLLTKAQATDDEFNAARDAIKLASDRVNGLDQADDDFGKKLIQRANEVKASIARIEAKESFKDINAKLPGPYKTVKGITTPIPLESYSSVDLAIEKLILIGKYVELLEEIDESAVKDSLKGKLVDFLQPSSRTALISARLLIREMKDKVYWETLKEALRDNGAEIDVNPSYAHYEGTPLNLCVSFKRRAIDRAAAREELSCFWNFDDGLRETGWNVSHYFLFRTPDEENPSLFKRLISRFKKEKTQKFIVKATFQDSEGKEVEANGLPVVVSKELTVKRGALGNLGERSWTEALKLSAALLIAVFGLVAGAREQLLKLDVLPGLIAVFLVGFGADTIKNLLTTKA